jgi:L-rhamnose isomerase
MDVESQLLDIRVSVVVPLKSRYFILSLCRDVALLDDIATFLEYMYVTLPTRIPTTGEIGRSVDLLMALCESTRIPCSSEASTNLHSRIRRMCQTECHHRDLDRIIHMLDSFDSCRERVGTWVIGELHLWALYRYQ